MNFFLNFAVEKRPGSPYRTHIACRSESFAEIERAVGGIVPLVLAAVGRLREHAVGFDLPARHQAGAWMVAVYD